MAKYTISVEVTDPDITPEKLVWLLSEACSTIDILPEGER